MITWRVYHRPQQRVSSGINAVKKVADPPAVYLNDVVADTSFEALAVALETFKSHRPLSVVAAASWRCMSTMEKSVFLGTFLPPLEAARTVDGVRVSLCKGCRLPILQKRVSGKTRHGRPPLWHEECAPREVLRFRKYAKKRQRS